MSNSKQNRFMLLIIIVLLVSNISTIGTILYIRNHEHKTTTTTETSQDDMNMPRGMFFKEKLGLSADQHVIFRSFHQNYNRTSRSVTDELDQKRTEMVEELGKDNSDSLKLQKIAEDIGKLHTELKQLTIAYYLQMESELDQNQKDSLYQIFNGLLNKDGNVTLPQPGGQYRWGQRKNQQNGSDNERN